MYSDMEFGEHQLLISKYNHPNFQLNLVKRNGDMAPDGEKSFFF